MAEQKGLSLLEVLIASAILSILVFGIVQSVGSLAMETKHSRDRLTASLLASGLREEILSKPLRDPNQPPVFGKEPGEYGNVRIYFDDRDDYDGLEDNPVTDLKGNPMPGMERYSRTIKILRVSEDDPQKEDKTGISRLFLYTVVVRKDGAEQTRLEWLEARP